MSAIKKLRQLGKDTRGMSTVEYALLLVLIVAGAVGIWTKIGKKVTDNLQTSKTELDGATMYKPAP